MRCRAFSGIRLYNYYVNLQTSFYGKYEGVETLCSNVYVGTAEIGPWAAISSVQITGRTVGSWKQCRSRKRRTKKNTEPPCQP